MIKQTLTYNDVDGNPVTDDFYFNLSKAEIFELEVAYSEDGKKSFTDALKEIAESGNPRLILDTFKDIIGRSYGVRSEDGKRFIKSPELFKEFTETEAYSEFYFSLCTDANKAAEFIAGLLPKNLVTEDLKAKVREDMGLSTPRERSEAQLQGYKQKNENKASDSAVAAPPVQVVIDEAPQLTQEEIAAVIAQRNAQANLQ